MRYSAEFDFRDSSGVWIPTGFRFKSLPLSAVCSGAALWRLLEQSVAVELTENEQCYLPEDEGAYLCRDNWRARVVPLVKGDLIAHASVVYLGKEVK